MVHGDRTAEKFYSSLSGLFGVIDSVKDVLTVRRPRSMHILFTSILFYINHCILCILCNYQKGDLFNRQTNQSRDTLNKARANEYGA